LQIWSSETEPPPKPQTVQIEACNGLVSEDQDRSKNNGPRSLTPDFPIFGFSRMAVTAIQGFGVADLLVVDVEDNVDSSVMNVTTVVDQVSVSSHDDVRAVD
jgi:hypothetical protein